MKNNFITLKDSKGIKKEYRIILNVEDTTNDVNYLVYTDDTKRKDGSIKAYASTYVLSKSGNVTKLKPVCMKEEFDFIDKILESLELK